MDPQQIRDEMKATRERIDRKLDLLQTESARRKGRAKLIAFAGGALASAMFFMWARRRARPSSR